MMDGRPPMLRAWPAWLALTACGVALSVGCGVVNPSLLGAVGSNTASNITAPQGYIVILLVNRSAVSTQARVQIRKENGAVQDLTLSSEPFNFFAFTQECGVTSIQFQTFGYAATTGTTNVNANLGVLRVGETFNCGNVIAVVANGNPPTFTVEVY